MIIVAMPVMIVGSFIIDKLVVRYSSRVVRKFSFALLCSVVLLVGVSFILNVCNQLMALCSIGMKHMANMLYIMS